MVVIRLIGSSWIACFINKTKQKRNSKVTEPNNMCAIEVQKKVLFWKGEIAFTSGPFLHFTGIPFQCNKKELITPCEQDMTK